MKKHLIAALCTVILGAGYFYVNIPALNWRSGAFWGFLFFLLVVYAAVYCFQRLFCVRPVDDKKHPKPDQMFRRLLLEDKAKRTLKIVGIVLGVFVVAWAVIGISSSTLFNARRYQQLITVEDRDFAADIDEISFSQIPVVDKSTAQQLGSRKIGEVVELVSQFDVSDLYTQINYNGTPYRVSPLQYNSFIKWIVNQKQGIPYYVTIDMATQETQLVELPEGMKYSPSEYFNRDLYRHVRFAYPTKMFENVTFEIDDAGNPYWIVSTYTYTIGVLGGKDIDGVIMVNAITGEMEYYTVAEIPSWVDGAYSANLVIQQVNYWGAFGKGFWNSVFTQSGVIATTDGYNYIAQDDDVWLFTGLTSVVSDESNIGFVCVNMRTKECRRYIVNGAEEYSAMSSAEGKVQEKKYTATFPILLNIGDTPTYFISLKDNAGLVKSYAFVSVSSYQTVAVGDSVQAAKEAYLQLVGSSEAEEQTAELQTVTGSILQIASAVRDGNTYYYLRLSGEEVIYVAPISAGDLLPFLAVGDTVTLTYPATQETTVPVTAVSSANQ